MLFTMIFAFGVLGVWLSPSQRTITVVATTTQILAILGLLVLVVLRFAAGGEALARVWLV